jgi:hypothetical protein
MTTGFPDSPGIPIVIFFAPVRHHGSVFSNIILMRYVIPAQA